MSDLLTQVQSMIAAAQQPAPIVLTAGDTEILLALSWAGPFMIKHLKALVAPAFASEQRTRKHIRRLERAGLIAGRVVYAPHTATQTQPPKRQGKFFTVTDLGRQCIVGHDREPRRDKAPQERRILAQHDGWVSSTIVHLITQNRRILTGVGTFREMRIDAEQTRPIADCVIWMRTRKQVVNTRIIHWSREYLQRGESVCVCAIEVDRGTEDLGVIAAKAVSYHATATNTHFLKKYNGVMPMALWVAPDEKRMLAIHERWKAVWPDGTWWLTHDQAMLQDEFWEYTDYQTHPCCWMHIWDTPGNA